MPAIHQSHSPSISEATHLKLLFAVSLRSSIPNDAAGLPLVKAYRPERSSYNISFDRRGGRESESERLEREEGGRREETERWKEKGGRRGGSDVRDDGARSKVSHKSQMSLDLLARQLPETSGIPKMASVGGGAAPRSSTSDGKFPRYL